MSRSLKLLLVLLLVATLLCGCSSKQKEKHINCNDLYLTLPFGFSDFSEDGAKEGLAFNYADTQIGVCGMFESKETLMAYMPEMDALIYAQVFAETNGLQDVPETVDGIPSFTYTVGGYTYLCGVFESDENFWVVQSYCQEKDFEANRDQMWEYICSVDVYN